MVDLRIYQNEIKTKASKLQKEVNEMQGKLHKEHTHPTMSFKSHSYITIENMILSEYFNDLGLLIFN
jgi:hypothetical protein